MTFSLKDFLRLEVRPALGCTEPVAAALAASAAASLLDRGPAQAVHLRVDPNVFKNGLAVSIPGTGGRKGLQLAAALGAMLQRPERGMEVLAELDQEAMRRAQALVQGGAVRLETAGGEPSPFIQATVSSGGRSAASTIRGSHESIVALERDGEPIREHPLLGSGPGGRGSVAELEAWLHNLALDDLLALAGTLDQEDEAFLQRGMDMNEALARHGLEHGSGLGVGRALERLTGTGRLCRDMHAAAKILTAAAADARMAGADLPAMSSAGSGNNGLTAFLPLRAALDFVPCPSRRALEAVALSHLVTAYIKTHTGKLSAICSCSIAAGAGAAAGLVRILDGDRRAVGAAVCNLIGDLGGVLCDGAKAGCALKLATASGAAVQAALLALEGVAIPERDGIIGRTPEQTIANLGLISRQGMRNTERDILDILGASQSAAPSGASDPKKGEAP